jgi:predicted small integral membrane protein
MKTKKSMMVGLDEVLELQALVANPKMGIMRINSTFGNNCIAVNCTSTHVSLASIVCI